MPCVKCCHFQTVGKTSGKPLVIKLVLNLLGGKWKENCSWKTSNFKCNHDVFFLHFISLLFYNYFIIIHQKKHFFKCLRKCIFRNLHVLQKCNSEIFYNILDFLIQKENKMLTRVKVNRFSVQNYTEFFFFFCNCSF